MKTILSSAAVTLALITAAFAGEVQGVVAQVDPDARMLMLESGETFALAEDISVEGLEPGTQVVVTFEDGTTNATSVAPAG